MKNISMTLTAANLLYKIIERYDDGRLYRVWCQLELGLSFNVDGIELKQINNIIDQAEKDGKDVYHVRRMVNA